MTPPRKYSVLSAGSAHRHPAASNDPTQGDHTRNRTNERQTSRRHFLAGLTGVAALPLLAACSSSDDDGSSLADQANEADGKNYIAGDGSVMEIDPGERESPVEFSSTLFSGEDVNSADWRGTPVLLNFWYAACAPCRVEAPDLKDLHEEFGEKMQFFGVNVRDTEGTAAAFERNFSIEYPSMEDRNGQVLQAMTDYVPPQAVPTTIILDAEGRVASRILGTAEHGTLKSLIESAVTE